MILLNGTNSKNIPQKTKHMCSGSKHLLDKIKFIFSTDAYSKFLVQYELIICLTLLYIEFFVLHKRKFKLNKMYNKKGR